MSEPDTIANPDLEPNQALALSAAAESATASALLADADKTASKVPDPEQQKDAMKAVRMLMAKLK